jgi:Flp pilus assembly protein TadG
MNMRRRAEWPTLCGDAGLMVIEFVLWTPFLVLVLLFVVAAGRIMQAGSYAHGAAADAARAASLQRDTTQARAAAEAAARQSLGIAGISCRTFSVSVTGAVAPGQVVTVSISCTTPLSDLVPGLPGSRTLTATALSPVEWTRQ